MVGVALPGRLGQDHSRAAVPRTSGHDRIPLAEDGYGENRSFMGVWRKHQPGGESDIRHLEASEVDNFERRTAERDGFRLRPGHVPLLYPRGDTLGMGRAVHTGCGHDVSCIDKRMMLDAREGSAASFGPPFSGHD